MKQTINILKKNTVNVVKKSHYIQNSVGGAFVSQEEK